MMMMMMMMMMMIGSLMSTAHDEVNSNNVQEVTVIYQKRFLIQTPQNQSTNMRKNVKQGSCFYLDTGVLFSTVSFFLWHSHWASQSFLQSAMFDWTLEHIKINLFHCSLLKDLCYQHFSANLSTWPLFSSHTTLQSF